MQNLYNVWKISAFKAEVSHSNNTTLTTQTSMIHRGKTNINADFLMKMKRYVENKRA